MHVIIHGLSATAGTIWSSNTHWNTSAMKPRPVMLMATLPVDRTTDGNTDKMTKLLSTRNSNTCVVDGKMSWPLTVTST